MSGNGYPGDPRKLNLLWQDGERVLVRRVTPEPEPSVRELLEARLCPEGHLPNLMRRSCVRCGTKL